MRAYLCLQFLLLLPLLLLWPGLFSLSCRQKSVRFSVRFTGGNVVKQWPLAHKAWVRSQLGVSGGDGM